MFLSGERATGVRGKIRYIFHHNIVGRDAIGCNEQQYPIIYGVEVSDFAPRDKRKAARKVCSSNYFRIHRLKTMIVASKWQNVSGNGSSRSLEDGTYIFWRGSN